MALVGEELNDSDLKLIKLARETVLQERVNPDRHRIAAAFLTESGETFVGVCVQAEYIKPTGVCAERIALGQWATAACSSPVVSIASVRKPRPTEPDQEIKVLPSCGICREILTDYFPEARLVVADAEGLRKYRLLDTLPLKYQSHPRES